jgi:DNA-binding transcriptional MerR regulator
MRYSIRDLERFTGIKAHTIRIWEQRYDILEPYRTETNIRYYDEQHLKLLLNISLLLDKGYKISKISCLGEEDFNEAVRRAYESDMLEPSDDAIEQKINSLIMAMLDLDEARFDKIFNTSMIKRGFQQTVLKLIYPFLLRVGSMWRTGEVLSAQEHFISHLIRQKVIVAIDALPMPDKYADTYMVFLPESEFNELIILLSTYLIKLGGHRNIYLGQNIPVSEVEQMAKLVQPKSILTFLTEPMAKEWACDFVSDLCQRFPDQNILISGTVPFMDCLCADNDALILDSLEDLNSYVKEA